jgi:A/G-specific adenine glycosylase
MNFLVLLHKEGKSIGQVLQQWWESHGRKLEWRETQNPYFILVAEIMLQQTQIATAIPYFKRFIQCFPTITHLAKGEETQVLQLWSGLGYYRRAIHLHQTAKIIVEKYQGQFPQDREQLLQLPGVGPYTANAILSLAFNQPYAVVDGNVYRVLSRFFYDPMPVNLQPQSYRHYQELANHLLNLSGIPSRIFNLAILDIGATICRPRKALCHQCPLSPWCQGKDKKDLYSFPKKKKRSNKNLQKYFLFYLIQKNGKTLVEYRSQNSFWKGLYTLPMVEVPETLFHQKQNALWRGKHLFSHFTMHYKICRIEDPLWVKEKSKEEAYHWIESNLLASLPLPAPIKKFLQEFSVLRDT